MTALTHWLVAAAGRGAAGLLVWSWQALLLLACVWPVMKICRAKSPALRHEIWLLGLLAVATLPWWVVVAQRFPALRPASPALGYLIEAPRMAVTSPPPAPARARPPAAPVRDAAGFSVKAVAESAVILPLLFAVWGLGVLILLSRLAGGHLRLRRALGRARPVGPADLGCPALGALAADEVGLRLSPDVDSPLLCGVFRHAILLPADIAEWTTPAERGAMIEHELAHVARRDALVHCFQIVLGTIFFFHPLVRYACRELSLEREMACDDRVVGMGASAEAYAEGILKVAERSLTPGGVHRLALFSAKRMLERRIEMILNRDRARVIARQWKYLIAPAGLIVMVAWLLIPAGTARRGLAQPQPDSAAHKLELVKSLGESRAYKDLIELALRDPDEELRRLAAIRLTELEGDGSTAAMLELYDKSGDPVVKMMVVDTLGRISEIEPLTKIALSDQSPEYRRRALLRIKWLKATSESADIKGWDVSALQEQLDELPLPPPPPPPPPPPSSEMAVEADKAPPPLRWHQDRESVFALLREAVSAHIRHDTSFFERVLDDDYIGTGPDGETTNKAQEIAEVKRLDHLVRKFEFDDLRVSGSDETALVTYLGTVYFQANGQDSTAQYRYTVNFSKRAGQWKIVAIHMSRKQ